MPTTRYFVIFVVSLFCIALELFLTRILNLKAWNHVVYIVIPFSILGYGIGANLFLIFKKKFEHVKEDHVLAAAMMTLAATCVISTMSIIYMPVYVDYLLTLFQGVRSILMLLACYTMFMVPFIFVGFIVVYLFSRHTAGASKLYFFDLIGAGLGAFLFFP
ncbi:MAG: hypothetical protein KC684_07865, partial [Candidatus Omnitrophica bacterium]|nr:hypothetical protein [Candidatus Omnitrophota bacterium]